MLEDAKRGMEIGEKVMIELFTTPKEQVKIELFQYILFSRAGEFSKDLREKLNLKNETFRRYSKELEEDIHALFGQDIKIVKKSSKIVIKMKNEMTPDYIVTRLQLNYMRKSPLYSLLSALISKSYTSIPEIAYDLNFSEPTVYKLLTQVKEIMLPFKAEFDLANATNFSGDELGVRYFLYLTHWHLFNTLGKKPFSDAFPPEFIDINFLKRALKIERKLSKAQEQKLLILAGVTSYRIVYFKKYAKVEKAFLEDISIFYRGQHCLNIASFNVAPEIIEKESILLSFLVRGLIFEFDDMNEKKTLVEKFQKSELPIGYEVSLFLEKFRETFSFEFSEENYVKSYYLLVLTNLYSRYIQFNVDFYRAVPIEKNYELFEKKPRYRAVKERLNQTITYFPSTQKLSDLERKSLTALLYTIYELNAPSIPVQVYINHTSSIVNSFYIQNTLKKFFNSDLIAFCKTIPEADVIISSDPEGNFLSKDVFYFKNIFDKKTWTDLIEFLSKSLYEKRFR